MRHHTGRTFDRRRFHVALILALACVFAWTVAPAPSRADEAMPIKNIHATFSGDPRHDVTVSWRTEAALPAPAVRFGRADAAEADWVEVHKAETVESAGGFNHHVKLAELEPSTRYAYRVSGPDGAWGPVCSFRTGPGGMEPFTFAVIGDVQGYERPSAIWQTLGRWLTEQDVAFLLQLGDLVQTGGVQEQWDAFFNCATPESDRSLFHSTVVMPVLGNHDHQITDEQKEAGDVTAGLRLYLDQFRLPPNANPVLDGLNYTFTYGDARFVILDTTGMSREGESTHVLQTRWLESLDLEDREWVFAAHHVPVFQFRNHVPSTSARGVWRPHFYRRYMDVVFNGHNHSYAVSWPLAAADLDGADGGAGFAGPWKARADVGCESGMDGMFLLEENDLVRYEGYQAVGRSLGSVPVGTHTGDGERVADATRPLKPIDTTGKRELWLGYLYKKLGAYYGGGGGWRLSDSNKPDRFLHVSATRVTSDAGRFGHFWMAMGDRSAVSREPITTEGRDGIPEEPYFVLAKFTFEDGRAVGRLKAYLSPQALPTKEPTEWDIELEAEGDWALKLDTLTHPGQRSNRLSMVDEFRLGERMSDVLLVPADGGDAKRSPLVEERFDMAPTVDREHGVVYIDTGGVNSSGEARDEWFVRFRENASNMPIVILMTVTSEAVKARTVFYANFEDYKTGDVFNEFEMRRLARNP